MGYPMTWKRVVNRNALTDGDYQSAPVGWEPRVNTELMRDEQRAAAYPHLANRLDEFRRQATRLAGDLRRVERDALDEHVVCAAIERRTGINREVVAAVLVEFFNV